ncbi:glycoside hydrolase family 30 protein [Pedobacter sp. AW31-3R]|uniref:glycoside hydrolase family 30 protein n=1 Tax=Pedobacter sp. AW31-3R TaxID=3445781 RepID=UPI003F9F5848
MKKYILIACTVALAACSSKKTATDVVKGKGDIAFWITKGDQSALLKEQDVALNFGTVQNNYPSIEVDGLQKFQSIDGFGYTLTGGSASLINALPESQKDALLKELFSSDKNGIGVSYLRLSIGASDLSADTFTYNELPAGQTDVKQDKFSISPEMSDLIPVLKRIVAIQPGIKILGSPWTAPTWMKTNGSFKGGSLKPEYYASYANYLIKYIRAMKDQGVIIDAITIQNEPLHPGNVPSMYMEAKDQAIFIKTALGPLFKSAGIKTKIIVYDHNADKPEYPIEILNDADAKPYVDGSAFHLYGGEISALSKVHEAHPDRNVYFTEQWVGGPGNFAEDLKWHVSALIIGATRNWSRNVLEWNVAADPNYGPHTVGGCVTCLGALTISPAVTRNVAYYVIGHASKFVKPGAVRIASTITADLQNVAFVNPDGKKVLIVVNGSKSAQQFNIREDGEVATTSLDGGAVATYIW